MESAQDLLEKTLAVIEARRHFPESTYRLQFHAGFTFRDAARARALPARPGRHPLLRLALPQGPARAARTATTSPTTSRSTPRSAATEDYDAWVAALHGHGMGQILDIVPNHMGIAGNDNAWWNDVLENGPASPLRRLLRHRLARVARGRSCTTRCCCPSSATRTARCWSPGSSGWRFDGGAFAIDYYDHRFPVGPRSYAAILGQRLDELERSSGPSDPALHRVPEHPDGGRAPAAAHGDRPGRGRRAAAREGGDQAAAGRRWPSDSAAGARVHRAERRAVQRQARRPAQLRPARRPARRPGATGCRYWRVAAEEINYRRFFDINDLAALSMEQRGGLRGHPRADPAPARPRARSTACASTTPTACTTRAVPPPAPGALRPAPAPAASSTASPQYRGPGLGGGRRAAAGAHRAQAARQGQAPLRRPLYVVVEKILGDDEPLPEDWAGPRHHRLRLPQRGQRPVRRRRTAQAVHAGSTSDWTGDDTPFAELVYQKKCLILQVVAGQRAEHAGPPARPAGPEEPLVARLHAQQPARTRCARSSPASRSTAPTSPTTASTTRDRRYVETAVRRAKRRNPPSSRSLFDFVRDMLLLKYPGGGHGRRTGPSSGASPASSSR